MDDEPYEWMADFGLGPVLWIIGNYPRAGDWTEALLTSYPELTPEQADWLVGKGLAAREAARRRAEGDLPPVEPIGRRGRPKAPTALRWRYRIRIRIDKGGGAKPKYITETVESNGPLSDEQLGNEADMLAEDYTDDGRSDTAGGSYGGYEVLAVTRY